MSPAFVLCLFSTAAMTGLIWLVQLVHYPLFSQVGADQFAAYEEAHGRRITPIVLPLMLVELLTSIMLVVRPSTEIQTAGFQNWMVAGLVLVVLIWASTMFLQVPMHNILEKGFDQRAWRFLVLSNWVRTVCWTARSAILCWIATGLR